MDTLELLSEITNAFGPSGFEDDVVAIARGYAPTGAQLQEDSLRNLYIRRPQDSARLVLRFHPFGRRIGIGHDAGTGLDV